MAHSSPATPSWPRWLAAILLAAPVTLAGLMVVGLLWHGNDHGVFLLTAWLLGPLLMVAERLDLPDRAAVPILLLQWAMWTLLIERGIERVMRARTAS